MDRKAAPLLRGWVKRLRESGVRFHVQHRWLGWDAAGALRFATADGEIAIAADATVLALGGGSWPQLGSDGAWVEVLAAQGVAIAPLQAANCGFDVGWSSFLAQRHAGAPLKPVVAHWRDAAGSEHALQGECVLTETGIEGSLVYAIAADLRELITRDGEAELALDLAPGRTLERLRRDLAKPQGSRSLGEHLRRQTGLDGAKIGLLHEALDKAALQDRGRLAAAIKHLRLRLLRPRPIAEAISSAGGVQLESMDAGLMLRQRPGVFCAGEMLDWEAPTGGYLLTASIASGLRAGHSAVHWLHRSTATR
jgi:uncharacterized flavoprotein (TIGR03862 family)